MSLRGGWWWRGGWRGRGSLGSDTRDYSDPLLFCSGR